MPTVLITYVPISTCLQYKLLNKLLYVYYKSLFSSLFSRVIAINGGILLGKFNSALGRFNYALLIASHFANTELETKKIIGS